MSQPSRALTCLCLLHLTGCAESPRAATDARVAEVAVPAAADGRAADASTPETDGGLAVARLSPCRGQGGGSFSIPVSHGDARWMRRGRFAGLGIQGYLDGPRLQMRSYNPPGRFGFFETGGEYVFRAYDEQTGRYITLAGSARGYLDGPFSRARFGGWGYSATLRAACAPDGSLYVLEPLLGVVRRLDFEREQVTTVTHETDGARALAFDELGVLYLAGYGNTIRRVHPSGASDTQSIEPAFISHGFGVAMDNKHDRLYGANRCAGNWYVWYWDLASQGKFVGVLAIPGEGETKRALNATGPFEGTWLHCPSGIAFGPDDPDHRYLYYGGGDNTTFFRLDLVKQWIDTWGPVDPSQSAPFTDLTWVEAPGKFPFKSVVSWAGTPGWDEGDIYLGDAIWPDLIRFERVK